MVRDRGLQEVEDYLDQKRDKEQYDPNQSEEERRELRAKYRNLTENALEKRKELTAHDNGEKLYRYLDKANVLFERVKNTQEAVLDSRFLGVSAEINAMKAKNIKIGTETEVDLDEFVEKVITCSRDGSNHDDDTGLDWELIGKRSCQFGKRMYTMDFLLGPLKSERKEQKRAKSSRLVKNKDALVRPDQLKEGDIKKQENETSNNVNNIYKILCEVQPINYFVFVTNPESFSQTVENIFYVSFLVRNGVVGIDMEDGQPILGLKQKVEVETLEDVVQKKQIIMGIDHKDYNDIISTYKITRSHIPTRESTANVAPGKGWY